MASRSKLLHTVLKDYFPHAEFKSRGPTGAAETLIAKGDLRSARVIYGSLGVVVYRYFDVDVQETVEVQESVITVPWEGTENGPYDVCDLIIYLLLTNSPSEFDEVVSECELIRSWLAFAI